MWLRSRMVSGLQSWRSTAVERPQAFPSLINSSADSTGADVGAIVGKTAPSALSNAFIDTEHLLVDVTVVRVTGYAELSLWKRDRKSTRLNSSHGSISYAVFCLKKKKRNITVYQYSPTRPVTT